LFILKEKSPSEIEKIDKDTPFHVTPDKSNLASESDDEEDQILTTKRKHPIIAQVVL
jgi:hypothetical protein